MLAMRAYHAGHTCRLLARTAIAQVCIAQRTGQRISGPLFFGFSDPLTQRAIAVNLYTPAELAAALRVRRLLKCCATGR